MRWSKLKSLIEGRFAPTVRDRISIHSAAYGNCTCGHCWITLDKEVIANFCTRAYFNKELHLHAETNRMYKRQFVVYGELSRQGAYQSMFEFVHSLGIESALQSDDVLVQALAVVDSRLGKRRLRSIDPERLHPLARKLLQVRRDAESGSKPGPRR